MCLQFPFSLSLNIIKAKSKNDQLQLYQGNWATLEIMKTLLKNKRSYRKCLQISNAEESERDNDNEGNGDELEEADIDEDGNGGEGGDEERNSDEEGNGGEEGGEEGNGGEEGDEEGNSGEEGNEEGNSDEGGIGYEGGNNEEGNESLDDIYKDIDNAAKKLAMEGNSNRKGGGGDKGNGHRQGNGDDREGNGCHLLAVHDNDQIGTAKKLRAAKKPGAAKKSGAAKKPEAAVRKLAEPAAGTKRKAQDNENGGDQTTGTKRNATRKAKKLRLDGE